MNKINETNTESTIRVVIIGDQAVGKSSIMLRYTQNVFNVKMMGTAGIDVRKKELIYQNIPIRMLIYDSAGHERFRQITQTQFKGAKGIILVYDLNDHKTFENVEQWIKSITENADYGAEVIIVGNKLDLQRDVSNEEIESISKKYKMSHMETSALTGENVDKVFDTLLENIMTKEIQVKTDNDIVLSQQKIVLEPLQKKNKKGCCS